MAINFLAEQEKDIVSFADNHKDSAYFGNHGLSLSQRFMIDREGRLFAKKVYLGGETNVEKNSSNNSVTITHSNGWEVKSNQLGSYQDLGSGQGLWTVLQGPAHGGGHALCINSPSKQNYSLAPFRILKTGITYITDTKKYQSDTVYGDTSLLRVSNTTSKTVDNKTSYTMNMGVSLYPNRIYMYNSIYNEKTVKGGSPTRTGGSIYYVPGDSYSGTRADNYQKKGNGNHFYFSRPICTSIVRLGSDGVNYLQTYIATSSSDFFPDTRYLFIGPDRNDVKNTYKKYTNDPTLTILRGRAISFNAYGTSNSDYSGWFYLRGSKTYLSYNMEIRGFGGWVTLKNGEVPVDKDGNIKSEAVGYYSSPTNDINNNDGKGSYRLLWVENCVLDSHSLNSKDTVNNGTRKRGYRINRVVVGSQGNDSNFEIRSGRGVYFKCDGVSTDGVDYSSKVLQFRALNFVVNGVTKNRGCFRPAKHNAVRLGSSSYRWHKIYLANAPVVTSDARKKEDITTIQNDSRYLTFYDNLDPVRFKWKKLGGDESDKFNLGLIAQDVEKALEKSNLTNEDFSAISCEKEEDEETAYYSLEYEQFIPLNMMKIKQLEKMIMQQQQEINELKSKLK